MVRNEKPDGEPTAAQEMHAADNQRFFGDRNITAIDRYLSHDFFVSAGKQMREEIQKRFPKTAEDTGVEIELVVSKLQEMYRDNPGALAVINDFTKRESFLLYEHRKKYREDDVLRVAVALKETALSEDTVAETQEVLSHKKILVLGDDSGSLSEILRSFGAEAYGIEMNPFSCLLAQSGILSENGEPQDQVLQGDIKDLTDTSSALWKQLSALGPFDLIYSTNVFNDGSGLTEVTAEDYDKEHGMHSLSYERTYGETHKHFLRKKSRVANPSNFAEKLNDGLFKLLNERGSCYHARASEKYLFGEYGDRPICNGEDVYLPKEQAEAILSNA